MEFKFGNNVITDSKDSLFGAFVVGGSCSGKTSLLIDAVDYIRNKNDNVEIHYYDPTQTDKEYLFKCNEKINLFQSIQDIKKDMDEIEKVMEERMDLFISSGVSNIKKYNKKVDKDKRVPYIVLAIDNVEELLDKPELNSQVVRMLTKGRAEGIFFIITSSKDYSDIRPLCPLVIAMRNPNIAEKVLQSKLYNADLNILHEPGDFIGELSLPPKDEDEEADVKLINTNIKYFSM